MANTDLRGTTNSETLAGANAYTKKIDFSENNGGAADTFQLFNIKDGQRIMVKLNVLTPEGAVATIDLVTTESVPQTLLDDADINATGKTAPVTIWTISEDCEINLVTNTAATDVAVVEVSVLMLDE